MNSSAFLFCDLTVDDWLKADMDGRTRELFGHAVVALREDSQNQAGDDLRVIVTSPRRRGGDCVDAVSGSA